MARATEGDSKSTPEELAQIAGLAQVWLRFAPGVVWGALAGSVWVRSARARRRDNGSGVVGARCSVGRGRFGKKKFARCPLRGAGAQRLIGAEVGLILGMEMGWKKRAKMNIFLTCFDPVFSRSGDRSGIASFADLSILSESEVIYHTLVHQMGVKSPEADLLPSAEGQ